MTTEQIRHWVCAATDVPVGHAVRTEVLGDPVAVFHAPTGFYALADRCSHADVPLLDGFVDGDAVECPGHFARFCLRTGQALALPATEPVASYPVTIVDDQIFLLVEKTSRSTS